MLVAALAIVALMLTTWVISVLIKNASIVDIVWGLGFVVVAWAVRISADGDAARQNLITLLVTLWGLRLALYLGRRNLGHGEDFRYVLMRRKHGEKFPWVSLYTVFGLQGALMWAVSLPVQLGQADDGVSVGPLAVIGTVIWVVGFVFETVGDAQLARFKKDPRERRQSDGQGTVEPHAPPQLLRGRGPVVGNRHHRGGGRHRRDRAHRPRRDDGAAHAGVGRADAGALDGEAPSRLRRVRGPHERVRAAAAEAPIARSRAPM